MSTRFAVLLLPSANRVYSAAAQNMAMAELSALVPLTPDSAISNIQNETIGGVAYISFNARTLCEYSIALLSNLSCLYALFEVVDSDKGAWLQPITIKPLDRYPDNLLSILKFAGKTNEQFTRLLINLTLQASEHASKAYVSDSKSQNIRLLDPLCGRGTSLNQALMYGFDASGIEIDKRDFEAYGVFINRWLKDNRLKHQSKTIELRQNSKTQAHRHQITLAPDKEAYKAGDVQTLDFVLGDTLKGLEFFKKRSFDIIVADLPYGIKHGNQSSQGLAKSPLTLLEQAVPIWSELLSAGGALGLAWNTFLARKSQLIPLLENAGLRIYTLTQGADFKHRVDQAIMRDIIIAVRS